MKKIACFVSPHGFGHATRVMAVLEPLTALHPDCHVDIFTTAPEALFASLPRSTWHPELVDIGMVQTSALTVDIPATCQALETFLPFAEERIARLATRCAGCSFILCDIAPLGIAVGRRAGIPTVLVENFTWDWIYEPYCDNYQSLLRHVRYLAELFAQADYRIQTEPLCREAGRDLLCGPIFRRIRTKPEEIRAQLQVGDQKLILITLGGVRQALPELSRLEKQKDCFFVIAGQPRTEQVAANCLLLQPNTDLGHPDLIGAADLVVCKAGYSTIAECCQAGARVLLIDRIAYNEADILQGYAKRVLGSEVIPPALYERGDWLPIAMKLLGREQPAPATENGADQVAALLSRLLEGRQAGEERIPKG